MSPDVRQAAIDRARIDMNKPDGADDPYRPQKKVDTVPAMQLVAFFEELYEHKFGDEAIPGNKDQTIKAVPDFMNRYGLDFQDMEDWLKFLVSKLNTNFKGGYGMVVSDKMLEQWPHGNRLKRQAEESTPATPTERMEAGTPTVNGMAGWTKEQKAEYWSGIYDGFTAPCDWNETDRNEFVRARI